MVSQSKCMFPTTLKLTRWLLLWVTICLFSIPTFAQQQVQQQAGYYTFGLNAGLSFQSSDVRSLYEGFGLGATLAKNLYYKPGAPISFDLRGRLLYAQQLGIDGQRSFDIAGNTVLNGSKLLDYTNYPAGLAEPQGFVFQNHKTDVFELGLEAVLTLNQLREKTGVVASIYGGLGFDWFLTKIDQTNASGQAYYQDYAGLNQQQSESAIQSQLRSAILDGDFETLADGFEAEGGTIGIMPSLGLELGYDVTPNFSIHAGHRFTFSGTDILDGHQWAEPNNDIYHYTNFALRWKVRPRETRLLAPVIEIITPNTIPYASPVVNGLVRARIRNVQNGADVTCSINGREQSFTYNRGQFSKPFRLQNGENVVIIRATNSVGSDEERVIIFYEEKAPPPPPVARVPDVIITQPSNSYTSTSSPNYTVTASINEIERKNQINFLVNGRNQNFTFNPSNGQFQANINLQGGENSIQIEASNSAGKDSESATIKLEVGVRPTVLITRPSRSPFTVENRSYELEASITDVPQRAGISVSMNGRNLSDFSYDANTGILRTNLNLQEGTNNIRILAQNEAGQGQAETSIIYQAPRQQRPPQVRITSPSNGFRTQSASTNIRATVQLVNNRNDIQIDLNGRAFNNFSFSNGTVTANIPLQMGANQIVVRGRNIDGQDEDRINVERFEEVIVRRPPTVNIQRPNNNSTSTRPSTDLVVSVREVNRTSDIQVLVNGRVFNNFRFDRARQEVTANVALISGNNSIQVTANNASGSDTDQVYITYRSNPPTVSIAQPTANQTVSSDRVNFRANVQNVTQKNQIELIVNGRQVYDFNFNSSRREVTALLRLQSNNNSIQIRVSNNDGQDEDQVSIRVQQPVVLPTVRIDRPANNATIESAQVQLSASTAKVSNKGQIQLSLNGQAVSNFNFNLLRGEITANLNLRSGNNTIRIRVQNNDGSDEDTVNVRFVMSSPPSVRITQPSANSESANSRVAFRATTKNVDDKNQIRLLVNGQTVNNFSYNSIRQEVSTDLTLNPGSNNISIEVNNGSGTSRDQVNVTYRQATPPTVSFTSPLNNSNTTTERVTVKVKTKNVKDRNELQFTLNGQAISNFGFQSARQEITAQVVLIPGRNTLTVSAQNADGNDNDQLTINYTPPKPPQVTIVQPQNGMKVSQASTILSASTQEVAQQEEISVTLNNLPVTDFKWDGQTLTANITNLKAGDNTIKVSVNNRNGSDEASVTINYTPVIRSRPPSISFVAPAEEEITHRENIYFVKAILKNVTAANQIQMNINRSPFTQFNFNPRNGELTFEMTLKNPRNSISITATTKGGNANARRIINYVPKEPQGDLPFVRVESVSQPTINPLNPGVARSTITATVKNVTAEQISLMVNSRNISNFTYRPETGFFQCTFTLDRGENRITLRAVSDAGQDQGVRTITF